MLPSVGFCLFVFSIVSVSKHVKGKYLNATRCVVDDENVNDMKQG